MMKTTTKTMLPNKKVAIILARVSSDAQVNGLKEQIEACEKYAANNGIEVTQHVTMIGNDVKVYEEHYKRLFELIDQHPGINTVLIDGYDRLARVGAMSIIVKCLLKNNGVDVLDITQTIVETAQGEEFMEKMLYLYSEFENNICRRKKKLSSKQP